MNDTAHPGRAHEWPACYAPAVLPCPRCGTPVRQLRLTCAPDPYPGSPCTLCDLACARCPATISLRGRRATVTHNRDCPWLVRYQAGAEAAAIPCGFTVIHRPRPPGVTHS